MHGNSRHITSTQTAAHRQLSAVVERHATSMFRKPIMDFNRAAFDGSVAAWKTAGAMPLILDAGCGVGMSTRNLALQFPDHFVIGVDQSADRLARNTHSTGATLNNCLLVRADLVDFWRLMLEAEMHPARHYLLYPNPWPKIGHLGRRWHGHAVFPTVLALGGILECRSNWRIYIEEMSSAIHQVTGLDVLCEAFHTAEPITPFEQKYLASRHSLWRCIADLNLREHR
ncbi:MAG TPA: methyltransferase domain-containing protein [Noviherbaspirillum sp.]|jgi:tRNA G46 methylase TrmB|uniref:tRNA (guanine(46)-N(7))-methyltransferase TrmB n=1 Tax=Noviherbaspirillum sp. TaxID=1926288 RepID=UPI002DDD5A4B|nr:methyltransferase domain-containing protein [Noviherbaspirillum sp.]HEV2609335.1 methyltransferase domain-containing protein [Noviherbaspirillum sp.]